jgi:RNase P/RNase MRP subunit p29
MVKVVNAKNKQLIGLEGLVVRETTRTFVLIKPNDQTKVLLKEGTVF